MAATAKAEVSWEVPITTLSGIATEIVDPIGDAPPRGVLGEVGIEHVPVGLPPAAAWVLEVAHQFLLLGVHAEDRQAVREIPPAEAGQVAELPVPVGVVCPGQTFSVGAERIVMLAEQASESPST